jgi:hypothetical protein
MTFPPNTYLIASITIRIIPIFPLYSGAFVYPYPYLSNTIHVMDMGKNMGRSYGTAD